MNITPAERESIEGALDAMAVLLPPTSPEAAAARQRYLLAVAIVRELPGGSGRRVRSDAHRGRPGPQQVMEV
ncbi:MAG: hypothetical protein EPN60_16915 [Nevskiaceae bacterium]|nr:MAG: hypothetical protein EPN60_16915 [Nevskiaceae bacterium]